MNLSITLLSLISLAYIKMQKGGGKGSKFQVIYKVKSATFLPLSFFINMFLGNFNLVMSTKHFRGIFRIQSNT